MSKTPEAQEAQEANDENYDDLEEDEDSYEEEEDGVDNSPVNAQTQPVYREDGKQLFGLDAEIYLKRQAARDPANEAGVIRWVEQITGESIPYPDEVQPKLRSGIILCNLLNKIKPNTVKYINDQKIAIAETENLSAYVTGCSQLGMESWALISPFDLYGAKDMLQVYVNLNALARTAYLHPTFKGPFFGPRPINKKHGGKKWKPVQTPGQKQVRQPPTKKSAQKKPVEPTIVDSVTNGVASLASGVGSGVMYVANGVGFAAWSVSAFVYSGFSSTTTTASTASATSSRTSSVPSSLSSSSSSSVSSSVSSSPISPSYSRPVSQATSIRPASEAITISSASKPSEKERDPFSKSLPSSFFSSTSPSGTNLSRAATTSRVQQKSSPTTPTNEALPAKGSVRDLTSKFSALDAAAANKPQPPQSRNSVFSWFGF